MPPPSPRKDQMRRPRTTRRRRRSGSRGTYLPSQPWCWSSQSFLNSRLSFLVGQPRGHERLQRLGDRPIDLGQRHSGVFVTEFAGVPPAVVGYHDTPPHSTAMGSVFADGLPRFAHITDMQCSRIGGSWTGNALVEEPPSG